MSSNRTVLSLTLLVVPFFLPMSARADAPDSGFAYDDVKPNSGGSGDQDYLPGEQVTTQSGKKMRVWSTRGPVPVNQQPPAAPQLNDGSQQLPVGTSIIVDDRYGVRGGGLPVRPPVVPRR
jgi:hypothetical protein